MTADFDRNDSLGPTRIIQVREPGIGLEGILVIDNVAAGPAIGGLRMSPDVNTRECVRLARAMTLKNALAGLSHGGAKSVLIGDPKMPAADKEQLIRAFACALRDNHDYIFGPDMGTNEACMAWVQDEVGRAVGLPSELGGIPLDQIGATGWGLCHAIEVALPDCKLSMNGVRVAIQGFGAVGSHVAHYLAKRGARVIAVSDSRSTLSDSAGLDIERLRSLKASGHPVSDYGSGRVQDPSAIIDIECDIWIPAARPDILDESNVDRLHTRLVAQGANIPITRAAETRLHARGIINLPDIIANAGGVICAAMEYRHLGQSVAFRAIEDRIRSNTRAVLDEAHRNQVTPRQAAESLGEARIRKAMSLKRWSLF
ncbi:Glu/Leu/Phe/Val family dehydrogenase [Marinobacterium rhizophilum]|uniref:Glu/Leu/Phe/Val family dehydrogenase n=1 Tax=Marinobacterium rhizophilum TaxID=420402 RepID=UPI00036130E8|nr:Glu/Leu/Phe/Val dehydrogenase [Marinobacterium rhizophilum]